MDKKAKFPFFLEMNWAMCCGPFPSFILVKGDFSPTPSGSISTSTNMK